MRDVILDTFGYCAWYG